MKILLLYQDRQFIDILHLNPEEENIIRNYDESEELMDLMEYEKIDMILDKRGIDHDDFCPYSIVVDDDIPVFDEYSAECPVYVIR